MTSQKLRRKLSFCSETIELDSSSSYIPQYLNLKTTLSRKNVTCARFSNYNMICVQLEKRQKPPVMNLSETNKLRDYKKKRLMGSELIGIKENENKNDLLEGGGKLHKYQVSWPRSYQFCWNCYLFYIYYFVCWKGFLTIFKFSFVNFFEIEIQASKPKFKLTLLSFFLNFSYKICKISPNFYCHGWKKKLRC